MSFSFGSTTTAGSTFGTTTPSTGFAFGSGDAPKSLFGSSTESKPVFSFNTSGTAAPPAFGTTPSPFSLGAKTTASTTPLFGTPAAQTGSAFGANKPLSFGSFTSPPNQTVGSPGFGQSPPNVQVASPSNLPFGATQPTAQPTQGLSFGSPTTQASTGLTFGTPAASGFSFNKAPTAGSGFGFSTPASGFSQQPTTVTTTTAPQTGATFNLLPSATATTSSTSFAQPKSSFSFGAATAPTATGLAGFGSTTAAATTTPPFGAARTTSGFTAVPSAAAPAFSAATPTGFGFGANQTAAPSTGLSFGTVATTTTAGSGFGATATGLGAPATGLGATATGLGATATGFGLSQTAAPAKPFGAPTSTPLNFGGTTGLSFAATSAAPSSVAPSSVAPPSAAPPSVAPSSGAPTSTAAPGGLSLTATPPLSFSAKPAATTSAPGFAAPTGGALNFGAATTAATTSAAGFQLAQKPAGLGGFNLTSSASTQPSIATTASGITALAKPTTSTLPSLVTTQTTTAATVAPAPVTSMTFAQLEEGINKWTQELETQESVFVNQATQINAWDKLLIANGEKIVELNDAVQTVKNEQQSLEHELDFILSQQTELEVLLTPLEKQLLEDAGDRLRDPEREHMYQLSESLDSQLKQMSEDLKEVIEHLNETNRGQDSSDPIVQISRILNAHMSSMQWVDNSIAQISTRLDQLKATHDTLRRDNERSFHLTYN